MNGVFKRSNAIIVRISSVIFLFFSPIFLLGQDVTSIKNGENYKPENVVPFLRGLYNTNDLVISYRMHLAKDGEERSDYFILTKKGASLTAYNYLEKNKQLTAVHLAKESLDLIWDTFVQNELFSIKNEKDIPNFCPGKYRIDNSHTYEFVLLGKGSMKRLSYYDPEYYDNACYGMPERRKIINSASVIYYVLTQ